MQDFIHRKNIEHYRKLLAGRTLDEGMHEYVSRHSNHGALEPAGEEVSKVLIFSSDGKARSRDGDKPMQWVLAETITRRLALSDEDMVGQAIELARRKGWLDFAGGHSICLTDEGRRMAR